MNPAQIQTTSVARPPYAAGPRSVCRTSTWTLLLAMAASGCASTSSSPVATTDRDLADEPTPTWTPPPTPAPAPEQVLRERAERLWMARAADDWAAAYEFEDVRGVDGASVEKFVAWSEESQPFRVHDYRMDRVMTEGDFGWVELEVSTSARQFPGAPVRRIERWQTWQRLDGVWITVPERHADQFPKTPALRDLASEPLLRQRCEEYWTKRREENWEQLVDFCEPADRDQVEPFALAETQGILKYVSHDVRWVEATGNQARTQVYFVHKINDPNMTKAPPMALNITEKWVKVDGQWYIDLVGEAQTAAPQETTP